MLPGASAGFLHHGRVIDPKECNAGDNVSLHSDFRALAWNAPAIGEDPQRACAVIHLIDSFTENAVGLDDLANDSYFLVHELAGVSVDVADRHTLARHQRKSCDQCERERDDLALEDRQRHQRRERNPSALHVEKIERRGEHPADAVGHAGDHRRLRMERDETEQAGHER